MGHTPWPTAYGETSEVRTVLTFKGREAPGSFWGGGDILPSALDTGYMTLK